MQRWVLSVAQLSYDVTRKVFFYFTVPRDGLTRSGLGIPIPIMTPAMSNEDTSVLLDLLDLIATLHAI